MGFIPEKINNFNAYRGIVEEATRLIGVTDEIELPNFSNMTETLSMAGMGGEIDSPTVGQFKSCQMVITFSNITKEQLEMAADDNEPIILRAAQEVIDTVTNKKGYKGRVITIRGMTKEINYGSLKKGGYGKPSITKEITAYQDVYDGTTLTDIDKWGTKCIIGGKDITAGISELI